MHSLDLALASIAANLALDEALLLQAETSTDGEALRVWEWPHHAVVLGSGAKLAEEVDEDACRADDVQILRRASGGGTVLLGPGCLLYTLVLSMERDPALAEVRQSYAHILDRISAALAGMLPDIRREGISDLAAGDRKFSGNAQQRKRRHLLHHGTLLYNFDLACISRYLRPPPRQPEYRRGRDHADFLCNLPTTADELKRRLVVAWEATESTGEWPADLVRQLVRDKYGKDEWTRRR